MGSTLSEYSAWFKRPVMDQALLSAQDMAMMERKNATERATAPTDDELRRRLLVRCPLVAWDGLLQSRVDGLQIYPRRDVVADFGWLWCARCRDRDGLGRDDGRAAQGRGVNVGHDALDGVASSDGGWRNGQFRSSVHGMGEYGACDRDLKLCG